MNSDTFSLRSSLDNDAVTLLDVWEHHGQHSSCHSLFQCTSPIKVGDTGSIITWGEAILAMHASGRIILDALVSGDVHHPNTDKEERPVIGILAVSG